MILEPRAVAFRAAFVLALSAAIAATPQDYAPLVQRQGNGDAALAVERMAEQVVPGLVKGTFANDGAGVRGACKALGIKPTYSAIRAYLSGA